MAATRCFRDMIERKFTVQCKDVTLDAFRVELRGELFVVVDCTLGVPVEEIEDGVSEATGVPKAFWESISDFSEESLDERLSVEVSEMTPEGNCDGWVMRLLEVKG